MFIKKSWKNPFHVYNEYKQVVKKPIIIALVGIQRDEEESRKGMER